METIAKKRKYGIVAIVVIAILVILAWILLSRPSSRTVEQTAYTPAEISGEYKPAEASDELTKVAEDAKTILYFDQNSGGIAIKDVATGELVESIPQGVWEDAKSSDDIKKQIASALVLTYYNISANKEVIFDSYTNAAQMNQISWAPLKDGSGVSVKMTLGREQSSLLIPEQISAARYEEVLADIEATIDERSARKVKALYLKYTYDTANDEQKAKYPSLEQTDIYVLKSDANSKNKEDLEAIFTQAGYTYEQMEQDYAELGYVSKTESFPCFKVTIEYRLEDGVVKVNMPVDAIEYDAESFILSKIQLLPFLGAGATGEEGYMLLPDGSGSIVPFNNDGSAKMLLTAGRTYGYDAAEENVDRGSQSNEFRYPVFGVKTNNHALLGIVTDGESVSQISCQVGNIAHSYNTAYADFTVSQKAQFNTNGFEEQPWIQYDKKGFKGTISMEYHLLTGDDADYVGMAAAYREYLLASKVDSEAETTESVPLMIDTLGTVDNYTRFFGVPGYRSVEVTTYEEAEAMLKELTEAGVGQIGLRYLTWCNGGFYNYPTTGLKLVKEVGSKSDLKSLQATVDELGGELFMDVDLMTAGQRKSFDPAYILSEDGIRTLFQKQAYTPHLVTPYLKVVGWDYSINPKKLLSYYEDFSKKYEKLGISNISMSTVGTVLNSNYKRSDYTNRQESESIVKELLRQADEKYQNILVDEGNAYTFTNADYILNLPTDHSAYNVEQKSVPFIQMALHGSVVYAGAPLNVSEDFDREVLRSIEYGCVPYFNLCDEDGSVLKNSYIKDTALYAVVYDLWKDRVVEAYQKINSALAGVQDAYMIDHEELQENLFVTKYDNGTQIYVNYSDADVSYNGVKVPALDCTVVKKGAGGNE